MISFIFLNLLILFISWTVSEHTVLWNLNVITQTAKPLVREFSEPWTSNIIKNQFFHYKTHFGIIIKQGTTFKLTIETSTTIENLHFYCLTESPSGTFNMLDLAGETNSTRIMTANFDCVPMTSVSYNIPVEVKIESRNWKLLPVFDSKDATLLTSEKLESEFYKNVKIYGFVENYYTQMLLSANDINNIKLSDYSLYQGLQSQIDVIEYYDYLTGANTYRNKENVFFLHLIDRSTLFIRSERCYDDFFETYTKEMLKSIFESSCGNGDKSCNFTKLISTSPCPNTYFDSHWIAVLDKIQSFLKPEKGSSWILLQKFGHYYNTDESIVGFGETFDLWNDIFAILYQLKFTTKKNQIEVACLNSSNVISNYQKGLLFKEWNREEKLNLFMSLFGYDGTDMSFREFHLRYLPFNKNTHGSFKNMIPTLLEVFLDLYDINLLPFLRKVINFNEYNIPLLKPDLELRLLSGHPVMPAIDFNINPTDLQLKSRQRDLRQFSPLMLLSKVKKIYVEVKFAIVSPINLTDTCLYLNNKCHNIVGELMKLKLLADVYSVYIVKEIDSNLYVSEVTYHTIARNMLIKVRVKKIHENKVFLPLVHYSVYARGLDDRLFAQMFINYQNMTITIQQFEDQIHHYFKDDLYFSIALERNGTSIFEYDFFGLPQDKQLLINVVHEFQVHDKIHIFHREPSRIDFEGFNNASPNNTFVFTNVGLHNVDDGVDFKFISLDIKRIDKFIKNYHVDLSYNTLYQVYRVRYIRTLLSNDLESYIPNDWFLLSNS